jgi:putative aldouronate transport system substrate-binding protein
MSNRLTSASVEDNIFTQRVVKETGVNLEIEWGGLNARERVNILLSTGTYPDIVINGLNRNDLLYYASQGIFIPLNKYDLQSFPHIGEGFKNFPWLTQTLGDADGNIYSLPYVNECIMCVFGNGRGWFFNPWIRGTNRKVPETLDEFADFLRYVKNTDLNRNGRKDEIPMAFSADDLYNAITFFADAYMPFNGTDYFGLALDGKKVVEQYKDARFREALKYMASLYKEGLLLQDSFTMTRDQFQSLITAETPVLGTAITSWMNAFAFPLTPRFPEWFMFMPVKGSNGVQFAGNGAPWTQGNPYYQITDKAKNPELAIALYDYFCDFEVNMDAMKGPKGVGWTDADPGAKSLLGNAVWKTLLAEESQPINSSWLQAAPNIRTVANYFGLQQCDDVDNMDKYLATGDLSLASSMAKNATYLDYMFIKKSQEQSKWAKSDSIFIPPLFLSDDDNARVSDIRAVLDTYKKKAFTEFLTGVTDPAKDSDWNAYLAELDRQGAKELAAILQKYVK